MLVPNARQLGRGGGGEVELARSRDSHPGYLMYYLNP